MVRWWRNRVLRNPNTEGLTPLRIATEITSRFRRLRRSVRFPHRTLRRKRRMDVISAAILSGVLVAKPPAAVDLLTGMVAANDLGGELGAVTHVTIVVGLGRGLQRGQRLRRRNQTQRSRRRLTLDCPVHVILDRSICGSGARQPGYLVNRTLKVSKQERRRTLGFRGWPIEIEGCELWPDFKFTKLLALFDPQARALV